MWFGSVDDFDCGSEPLSSIKCTELFDQLRNCYVCLFVMAGRPVCQCLSQTSQLKTHFTQSISYRSLHSANTDLFSTK